MFLIIGERCKHCTAIKSTFQDIVVFLLDASDYCYLLMFQQSNEFSLLQRYNLFSFGCCLLLLIFQQRAEYYTINIIVNWHYILASNFIQIYLALCASFSVQSGILISSMYNCTSVVQNRRAALTFSGFIFLLLLVGKKVGNN